MIFNKFFHKTNITKGIYLINFKDKDTQPEDRFFSDIHLYDDLKQLLSRMLVSKESVGLLSKPLRSRLMEFHLPEYNFDEFREIVVKLAAKGYRINREIADRIAFVVWYEMGTTYIDEVNKTARTIMKYKPKILNPSLTTHSD